MYEFDITEIITSEHYNPKEEEKDMSLDRIKHDSINLSLMGKSFDVPMEIDEEPIQNIRQSVLPNGTILWDKENTTR
jgi:hypothetical protein